MRRFTVIFSIAAAAAGAGVGLGVASAAPVSSVIVVAQAGSTGGTIGKRGKSAVGSEAPPAPKATAKPAAAPPPQRKADRKSVGGCSRVVGVWDWTDAFNSVETYRADGTVTSTSMDGTGRWTCQGNTVVIRWPNGVVERQTASNGFRKLHFVNRLGVASVGTKRGGN